MVDSPPRVVRLAIDLYEHLVQMPLPLRPGAQPLGTFLADLRSENQAEPVPPEPHRLVADVDAALVQKILYVPPREGEPHVHHHREANDFRARLDILERVAFRHPGTLPSPLPVASQVHLTRPAFERGRATSQPNRSKPVAKQRLV